MPGSYCPQFEIAHTTRRYSRVLEAVGQETVSSQDRLNKAGAACLLGCLLALLSAQSAFVCS